MYAAAGVIVAVSIALLFHTGMTQMEPAGAQSLAPTVRFQLIANSLDRPVDLQSAGDDRLFVVEQPGRIKILDGVGPQQSPNLLAQPFLDIADVVESDGEMGLLGLAFHPDYQANGRFFVNYTRGNPQRTRISEFERSTNDPNVADITSEVVVLEFDQPRQNHNGGQLAFGPDGYLYIAVGDGGGSGDPDNHAQDITTILGSILRIDVSTAAAAAIGPQCSTGPANGYGVPIDNPYVDTPGSCSEIWAHGLRNPWRFSFDSETNDFWVADVGQNEREELNWQANGAGANYGWRCYEGPIPFNTDGCGPSGDYSAPVFSYDQSGSDCSITGGHMYRGTDYPGLSGRYFFGDFCSSNYWSSEIVAGQVVTEPLAIDGERARAPSSFGLDSRGELYVASIGGAIYRVLDANASTQPEVAVVASCLAGNGRVDITISNRSSTSAAYTLLVGQVPARQVTVGPGQSRTSAITGRPDGALQTIVELEGATIYDKTTLISCDPEIDLRSSCLAENGRIDVTLRNRTQAVQQYAVVVGALAPRLRTVAPGATTLATVTGRPDGPIQVEVERSGVNVFAQTIDVACDPIVNEPIAASVSCLGGNGRVDVWIRNDEVTNATYEVNVGALQRTRSLASGSQQRVTVTGRPDGPIDVRVRLSDDPPGTQRFSVTLLVACD